MATQVELERLMIRLIGDGSSYFRMLQQAMSETVTFTDRATRLFSTLTATMTNALRDSVGTVLDAYAKFDHAMAQSTSILSGATGAQKKAMRDLALQISTQSVHAPEELAKAYYFLASAGLESTQAMKALGAVQQFAVSGAFSLEEATSLLVNAQTALGLRTKDAVKNHQSLIRMSDVLSKANEIADASVRQFSLSLTATAGATLRAFGKDVEEGAAALAVMANSGVKAELAGHALTRIMLLMSKGVRENTAEHKHFRFEVFDATGKMRNFADIIQNLEEITGDMSDEMKASTLAALGFEVRIQHALLPLLGMSTQMREFEKHLRNAGGSTDRVANEQMKSFINQSKVMYNNLKVLSIELGEVFAPALREIMRGVVGLSQAFRTLNPNTRAAIVGVLALLASIGPFILLVYGAVALIYSFGGVLLWFGTLIMSVFSGIGSVVLWAFSLIGSVVGFISLFVGSIGSLIALLTAGMGTIGTATVSVLTVLGTLVAVVIVAAAVLVNLITIAAALAVPFAFLTATITGFVNRAGGMGPAWEKVKKAALAAWDWMQPILRALYRFFTELFDMAAFWWGKIENLVMATWDAVVDYLSTNIDFKSWQDTFRDLAIYFDYFLHDFEDAWNLAFNAINYFGVKWTNELLHQLMHLWDYTLKWLAKNWNELYLFLYTVGEQVFTKLMAVLKALWNILSFQITLGMWNAWTGLIIKMAEALSKLPELAQGNVDFESIFDTKGANKSVEELQEQIKLLGKTGIYFPKLTPFIPGKAPDRQAGAFEQALKTIYDSSSQKFKRFRDNVLGKQFEFVPEALEDIIPDAEDKAEELGKRVGEAFSKAAGHGVKHWENTLVGSLAHIRQIEEYKDQILDPIREANKLYDEYGKKRAEQQQARANALLQRDVVEAHRKLYPVMAGRYPRGMEQFGGDILRMPLEHVAGFMERMAPRIVDQILLDLEHANPNDGPLSKQGFNLDRRIRQRALVDSLLKNLGNNADVFPADYVKTLQARIARETETLNRFEKYEANRPFRPGITRREWEDPVAELLPEHGGISPTEVAQEQLLRLDRMVNLLESILRKPSVTLNKANIKD